MAAFALFPMRPERDALRGRDLTRKAPSGIHRRLPISATQFWPRDATGVANSQKLTDSKKSPGNDTT